MRRASRGHRSDCGESDLSPESLTGEVRLSAPAALLRVAVDQVTRRCPSVINYRVILRNFPEATPPVTPLLERPANIISPMRGSLAGRAALLGALPSRRSWRDRRSHLEGVLWLPCGRGGRGRPGMREAGLGLEGGSRRDPPSSAPAGGPPATASATAAPRVGCASG